MTVMGYSYVICMDAWKGERIRTYVACCRLLSKFKLYLVHARSSRRVVWIGNNVLAQTDFIDHFSYRLPTKKQERGEHHGLYAATNKSIKRSGSAIGIPVQSTQAAPSFCGRLPGAASPAVPSPTAQTSVLFAARTRSQTVPRYLAKYTSRTEEGERCNDGRGCEPGREEHKSSAERKSG